MNLTNKKVEDVPPGLIEISEKGRLSKKRIFFLFLSAFLISAGILSVYFFENLRQRVEKEKPVAFEVKAPSTPEKPELSLSQPQPIETPKEEPKKEVSEKPKVTVKKPSQKAKIVPRKVETQEPMKQKEPKSTEDSRAEKDQGQDFLLRAHFFEKEGKMKEAIAEYKQYVRITGSQDPRILNKIAALCILDQDLNSALYFAELALRVSPKDPQILLNYGVIKAKLGEYDEAERIFRRILEIDPSNKKALYNLAFLKEKSGNKDEAERLYLLLKNLGDKEAEDAITRIRSYR